MGFVLALVWAALRFLDGQRTSPFSFHSEDYALRGVCAETKSIDSGQPFGIMAAGVTAGASDPKWTQLWATTLRKWADEAVSRGAHREGLDFAMPDVLPAGKRGEPEVLVARPMPYCVALARLRRTLQASWLGEVQLSPEQSRQYSMHVKATTLSWAAQLNIPEPIWAAQGHLRQHGGSRSVRLYSRDDVFP